MFVVKGKFFDRLFTFQWKDGGLKLIEGSKTLAPGINTIGQLIWHANLAPVGIGGMPFLAGHAVLENELYAWDLLRRELQDFELVDGAAPAAPSIPKGSVA